MLYRHNDHKDRRSSEPPIAIIGGECGPHQTSFSADDDSDHSDSGSAGSSVGKKIDYSPTQWTQLSQFCKPSSLYCNGT